MNTTNIETCTRTWNPVVGCKRKCPYCYACPIAIKLYKSFEPRFLPERLIAPRRDLVPQVVFVVNMGDLWGDWVDEGWIHKVLEACRAAPWHTYQFYTKGPARYAEFLDELPPKAWLGLTIDEGCDVDVNRVRSVSLPNDRRIELFNKVDYPRKFVSIEPFDHASMDFYKEQIPKMHVQWVHVGFRTFGGGRIDPKMPRWAWGNAAEVCIEFDKLHVPVWPKESIAATDPDSWPGKWAAKVPAGMPLAAPARKKVTA